LGNRQAAQFSGKSPILLGTPGSGRIARDWLANCGALSELGIYLDDRFEENVTKPILDLFQHDPADLVTLIVHGYQHAVVEIWIDFPAHLAC
jgi:hypothetical protein